MRAICPYVATLPRGTCRTSFQTLSLNSVGLGGDEKAGMGVLHERRAANPSRRLGRGEPEKTMLLLAAYQLEGAQFPGVKQDVEFRYWPGPGIGSFDNGGNQETTIR